MYRDTRFGQLLKGLSRDFISRTVQKHQANKYSKGFEFWDHLVAMLFNQLSGCRSLRELENGFNDQQAHHYHLGTQAIKRSTLADANTSRNPQPFADLANDLIQMVHQRKLKRELKDLIYAIDSSPIKLCGQGFDEWTLKSRTGRTQGLKLHLQYDLKQVLPVYFNVTSSTVNDVLDVRNIELEKNATYLIDKGYCDYSWWYRVNQAGAWFVTRLKANAAFAVDISHSIPVSDQDLIIADETIHLTNKNPGAKRKNPYAYKPLRRVTVHREDKKTPLILVTNDLDRSAREIAELYKARWSIELFFKWLKQNLKIKRFLGRSENAVRIQIYTAIIAYLLLAAHRIKHQLTTPMYQLLSSLKMSLFERTDTMNYTYRKRRERRETLRELQPGLAF